MIFVAITNYSPETKRPIDQLNYLIKGILQIYGYEESNNLYQLISLYHDISMKDFMNHMNTNRYIKFYYVSMDETNEDPNWQEEEPFNMICFEPFFEYYDMIKEGQIETKKSTKIA